METKKFTSGPWRLDESSFLLKVVSDDPFDIIVGSVGHEDTVESEMKANAKLIAAAPELYEACQAALTELQQYIPVTDVNVLNKVTNAIRKATT